MIKNVSDFCFNGGKVVVTCGPGYEALDEVRRLTNHSTGRLGTELSRALVGNGFDVICLRGTLSTWTRDLPGAEVRPFTTGEHLRAELESLGKRGNVGAVFHAAGLSDFQVRELRDGLGQVLGGRKISSRLGEVQMVLQPAPKVISQLRTYFPQALLVGWKYELDGTGDDVIRAGLRQIEENKIDACVLNGAAYGDGFGICRRGKNLQHFPSEEELFSEWVKQLGRKCG